MAYTPRSVTVDVKLSARTRAQLESAITELDHRHQAMAARQVDSINRLLGHHQDSRKTPDTRWMYEHELMTLNEQLALADVRADVVAGVVRRVRQHAIDTGNESLLKILEDLGDAFVVRDDQVVPAPHGN